MGTRVSHFMTKHCLQAVIRSIIHIFRWLCIQQTDHKSHTFHFIDHVQTCIIVTNNSDSAKTNKHKTTLLTM